jgi:hypothetical protein
MKKPKNIPTFYKSEGTPIYRDTTDIPPSTFNTGGFMNFKSSGAYHNWLGYVHANKLAESTPGHQEVSIKGKSHKVEHKKGGYMSPYQYFNEGGQLTEFNNGGEHEQNPLGGIPQGISPTGQLNLVEEGETKHNSENYIFSNSLKIDKETVDAFSLPSKYSGKTFADASKKANRESSRRENDSIEQNAIKRDLDNLMQAQETFKAKEAAKKLQEAESLMPGITQMNMQSPTMQSTDMPAQEQMPQEQSMMNYGGNMYEFGGNMKNPELLGKIGQGFTAAAPFLNMIPGVGQIASLGAGVIGKGLNMASEAGMQYDQKQVQESLMDKMNPQVDQSGMPIQQFDNGGNLGDPPVVPEGHTLNPNYSKQLEEYNYYNSLLKDPTSLVGKKLNPDSDIYKGLSPTSTSGLKLIEAYEGAGGDASHFAKYEEPQQFIKSPEPKAPINQGPFYMTHYATGEPVQDWNPTTNQYENRLAPEGSTQNIQYGQYGDQVANSPEVKLHQQNIDQERFNNQALINTMSPEDLAKMRELKKTPAQYMEEFGKPAFGQVTGEMIGSFEYGGDLDQLDESQIPVQVFDNGGELGFNPYLSNEQLENMDFGVPTEDPRLTFNPNTPNPSTSYSMDEEINQTGLGNIDLTYSPMENLGTTPTITQEEFSAMTPEEQAIYKSQLQQADETLKDKNLDLNMNQTPGQAIGTSIPALYNIGMGLFGKPMTLDAKDFERKARVTPYQYDINPALRQVEQSYAQAQNAVRNAGASGGTYLSNLQNLANTRNEATGELYSDKYNKDQAADFQSQVANQQLEQSNIANKLALAQFNAEAVARKQAMLSQGLTQAAEAARASQETDLMENYLKVVSPDFAKTFKYNTYADQLKDKAKAELEKRKAKKDK